VIGSDSGQVTVWKRADNTFKTIVTRLGSVRLSAFIVESLLVVIIVFFCFVCFEQIRSIRFSPDGLCIAVCGELPRVPLLDPVKSELLRYCDGLTSGVCCLVLIHSGR